MHDINHIKVRTAIYAGSFDPLTLGHLDVIKRSLGLVDKLIIAVGENVRKKYLFSITERIDMIETSLNDIDKSKIEITEFDGLLVDFANNANANIIIRGLRSISDFDYELQMGMTNQDLNSDIETIFLLPKKEYMFISSSMVREIAYFKKDFSKYVTKYVLDTFDKKFNR